MSKRILFYSSIVAGHVPIIDGIITKCQSLGLNVSVSFTPAFTIKQIEHSKNNMESVRLILMFIILQRLLRMR